MALSLSIPVVNGGVRASQTPFQISYLGNGGPRPSANVKVVATFRNIPTHIRVLHSTRQIHTLVPRCTPFKPTILIHTPQTVAGPGILTKVRQFLIASGIHKACANTHKSLSKIAIVRTTLRVIREGPKQVAVVG